MMDRRKVLCRLTGAAALLLAAPVRLPAAERVEPRMTDDGLFTQPWFLQSFLDLGEDLEEAAAGGKRLVVMWEQKGCPYCRETHLVNLARPEINDYVRDNFAVLQLNLWGSRPVTDFDGTVMEERELARRWRVNFTPTVQFFPPSLDDVGGRPGNEIEVARMPGYFKPFHFISMFEFVRAEAYRDQNFQRFLQAKFADLQSRGIDPNVW